MEKITALVGCQEQNCAENVSYPLYMVRMLKGKPICEECFDDLPVDDRLNPEDQDGDTIAWGALQSVALSDLAE